MNGGKVIYHFEADDSNLKQTTSRVGDIVKGNLISSAITTGIGKVVNGIGRIASGIGSLAVQGGFDRALNIENAEHKLIGLGHTEEEVEQISKDALKSVKNTAYGLDEAMTVAASSVAAGVQPGADLERTLKLIGDAAAISGRDMISMGAIFNKVAAAGKMTGEELNQLTDSGIPMLQLLGKTLGKSTEEVRDLVSQGKIGFDEFRNAIEQGMGGAALKMGDTFAGALANTKAAMSRLGKTFMEPFLKGMTPALNTLIEIIDMVNEETTEGLEEKTQLLSQQLGEMIQNVIKKALPIIKSALPIISGVITEVLKGIVDMMPDLIPIVVDMLIQFVNNIIGMLPTIISALINGFVTIIQALAQAAPTLIPQVVTAVIDAILTLLDNIDLMIDCGIQLLFGIMDGLIAALPTLIDKLPEIIDKIITALVDNAPKLLVAGITLIVELAKGLIKAIPQLLSKIPQICVSIVNGFSKYVSNMANVGTNLIKGLWNGISNVTSWIIGKIKGFGSSVMKAIKGIFGIHSPSTEFEWVGKMNMLGFEKGMEGMKSQVQSTIDSVFDLQPNVSGQMSSAYSPTMVVNVTNNLETDPLGQLVNNVKTFSGGAKNDYNWGAGI